jgi:hypothetical protein
MTFKKAEYLQKVSISSEAMDPGASPNDSRIVSTSFDTSCTSFFAFVL